MLLRLDAEFEHYLKLCSGKLVNHEEEDKFVRFLKSVELSNEYIYCTQNEVLYRGLGPCGGKD